MPGGHVFLTNRECPWQLPDVRSLAEHARRSLPPGAIPEQIARRCASSPPARRIKLYNGGSFFDRRAVPAEDYAAIAELVAPFERVVVESHPALVGPRCGPSATWIPGTLEVAMGLETVHPEVLPRLNKRMTLDQFRRAADFLAENAVALRVFMLAGLPWVPAAEARAWALRSVEFAFDCGAAVACRSSRPAPAMARWTSSRARERSAPRARHLEDCLGRGVARARTRLRRPLGPRRLFRCGHCFEARRRAPRER